MARSILATAAVALGAMLAASSNAKAGDNTPNPTGFTGNAASGTTMTLGGQGTAAQAASAEDIELMRGGGGGGRGGGGGGGRGGGGGGHASFSGGGHASFSGGGRGGFGGGAFGGGRGGFGGGFGGRGFGGRGFGYGGFGGYGGYGGYGGWGGYGGYGGGLYGGYWPYYYPYYYPYYGYGGLFGINGTADDASAPGAYLNSAVAQNAASTTQRLNDVPATQLASGLRYDGGPTNPVPYPAADSGSSSSTIPLGTALPVSLKKAQSTSPYTFKAYGEK